MKVFVWIVLSNWQVNSYIENKPVPLVLPTITNATPVSTPISQALEARKPSTAPSVTIPLPKDGLDSWIAASNWPVSLHSTVKRIVLCESGGDTTAVGAGLYIGLMQVNPNYHGQVPSDPVGQLNQGYEVYLKQGFGAWGCK